MRVETVTPTAPSPPISSNCSPPLGLRFFLDLGETPPLPAPLRPKSPHVYESELASINFFFPVARTTECEAGLCISVQISCVCTSKGVARSVSLGAAAQLWVPFFQVNKEDIEWGVCCHMRLLSTTALLRTVFQLGRCPLRAHVLVRIHMCILAPCNRLT